MSTLQANRALVAENLLKIVLADEGTAAKSASNLSRLGYWRLARNLAQAWRVVPQFKNRIDTLSLPLDQCMVHELKEAYIQSLANSMMALHVCGLVFREFNRMQLPAVSFKGVGLVCSLYGGPMDRSMNDLDILIRPDDFGRVHRALRALGFTPIVDRLTFYSDFLEDNALVLTNRDGFELDLHMGSDRGFGSSVLSAERIISRAESVDLRGTPVLVPNHLDAMMLTVRHTLHHNFDPKETVRDMCDLRRWGTAQLGKESFEDSAWEITRFGLLQPCLALWTILSTLEASKVTSEMREQLRMKASQVERQRAERLKALFEFQLKSRTVSSLLLRIMANPSGMGRYLASRVKKGPENIHALPNGQRRDAPVHVLNEVSLLARELMSLDEEKLGFYRALAHAHIGHR